METIFSSVLKYRASAHPQRIAYTFEGKVFTYEAYYQQCANVAAYLQSLGLKKGDRIGILDLNTPQAVNYISGAMLIGVIPVSLNWRAMPAEINFILIDAGIQHFFYGAAFAKLVAAVPFSAGVTVYKIEDEIKDENGIGINEKIYENDTCVILYTSGTTGNPKGVLISYKNIYSCTSCVRGIHLHLALMRETLYADHCIPFLVLALSFPVFMQVQLMCLRECLNQTWLQKL